MLDKMTNVYENASFYEHILQRVRKSLWNSCIAKTTVFMYTITWF